jgi:hypothetical protein
LHIQNLKFCPYRVKQHAVSVVNLLKLLIYTLPGSVKIRTHEVLVVASKVGWACGAGLLGKLVSESCRQGSRVLLRVELHLLGLVLYSVELLQLSQLIASDNVFQLLCLARLSFLLDSLLAQLSEVVPCWWLPSCHLLHLLSSASFLLHPATTINELFKVRKLRVSALLCQARVNVVLFYVFVAGTFVQNLDVPVRACVKLLTPVLTFTDQHGQLLLILRLNNARLISTSTARSSLGEELGLKANVRGRRQFGLTLHRVSEP